MCIEKYVTVAMGLVASLFILSSLSYCSVTEYYNDQELKTYIENGCVKSQGIGTTILVWECPERNIGESQAK